MGLQTKHQATVFILESLAKDPQKKFLVIFSICSKQALGRRKLEAQKICKAKRVEQIKSILPAKESMSNFQQASLFLNLSTRGWHSEEESLETPSSVWKSWASQRRSCLWNTFVYLRVCLYVCMYVHLSLIHNKQKIFDHLLVEMLLSSFLLLLLVVVVVVVVVRMWLKATTARL